MEDNFGCLVGIIVTSVILIIALVVVGMPFTTVPEGHVGVVVHFGEAQEDILYPGFSTKPLFSKVVDMDTRWQRYSIQTSAFSKDIQQVDITMSINYALQTQGALRMYKTVGTKYDESIILPLIHEATKSTFAKYSAEQLVSNRDLISEEVFAELSQELEFYDLSVKEVAIEDIDFSDAFTNAIEAKQVATQTLLQAETEQKQQTLVAQAEAERAKIKTEAEAEQKRIAAQADADAVKIAADAEAYRLEMESKHITEMTIRKSMIEKWDGELPVITGEGATPIINATDIL
jgi:regulator of protease activity HflC (stomatin/prohibitin superfamily)